MAGSRSSAPPGGRRSWRPSAPAGARRWPREDEQILAQRDRLATLEGVYAEPTSAAALAALALLARRGDVGPEDLVVVAVTGSGLKDPGPDAA